MLHFSLCKIARRVNHRVVEQAPGDGRFSRRPLLGADGFMFNTNRRGSETGSNGQEERAGLDIRVPRSVLQDILKNEPL